jgi:hypothetical protein
VGEGRGRGRLTGPDGHPGTAAAPGGGRGRPVADGEGDRYERERAEHRGGRGAAHTHGGEDRGTRLPVHERAECEPGQDAHGDGQCEPGAEAGGFTVAEQGTAADGRGRAKRTDVPEDPDVPEDSEAEDTKSSSERPARGAGGGHGDSHGAARSVSVPAGVRSAGTAASVTRRASRAGVSPSSQGTTSYVNRAVPSRVFRGVTPAPSGEISGSSIRWPSRAADSAMDGR